MLQLKHIKGTFDKMAEFELAVNDFLRNNTVEYVPDWVFNNTNEVMVLIWYDTTDKK